MITLSPQVWSLGQVVLANEYPVDDQGRVCPPSDLITLTHLHEPSVVESLHYRFLQDYIYTFTGPVLLALNPFHAVRGLYGEAVMKKHWEKAERNLTTELPPHVYAIADNAFRSMMRQLEDNSYATQDSSSDSNGSNTPHDRKSRTHQSILVSGESGSGKTVTTKLVMKYLAALSQRSAVLAQPEQCAYRKVVEQHQQQQKQQQMKKNNSSNTKHHASSYHRSSSDSFSLSPPSSALKTSHSANQVNQGWNQNRKSSSSVHQLQHYNSTGAINLSSSGSFTSNYSYSNRQGGNDINQVNSGGSNNNNSTNDFLLSGSSTAVSNSIEAQVLQSNPILESFGNARTVRNDNSSRFGKFIEIQFTSNGQLVGAQIETYLLEKIRLIRQAPGERNYHIFYELLSGALDSRELSQYFLARTARPCDFRLTASSKTWDRRDGVADRDTYRQLRMAMQTMKLSAEEIQEIFSVTAALLHASNLTFVELPGDTCELDVRNLHLPAVCHLLGITPDALNAALCYFSIMAGSQVVTRELSLPMAERGLEALLKETYGTLFHYLVRRINDSIAYKEKRSDSDQENEHESVSHTTTRRKPAASIGVLDIFGFESFTHNSFEQLCINYCNEALQQQFNAFVLQNEQAEYEREGIEWSFIEFPENQDVLDLIEKRGTGILSILDDQCRAPGPSDKAFALDVYKQCSGTSRFEATRKQTATLHFSVEHYAGPVEYSVEGFVEKNRDELPKEATELLKFSASYFVQDLAHLIESAHEVSRDAAPSTARLRRADSSVSRATVGGQFRRQLRDLRTKIDETSPHYVRCLKPNDILVPEVFDTAIVADQLRCGGILEAVRVARAGFTQHYLHTDFLRRYRTLAWRELGKRETVRQIQQQLPASRSRTPQKRNQGFGGFQGSSLHKQGYPSSPRAPEISAAEAQKLCSDLIKVLYKKIQQQEKEDGNESAQSDLDVESTRASSSTARSRSMGSNTNHSKAFSLLSKRRSNTTTPGELPPVHNNGSSNSSIISNNNSNSSIKSRYQSWDKKVETTTRERAPSPGAAWKRGGLTTTDFAKVGIQMGKTKVFLRHKAFEILERIRSREQTVAATRLNSIFRMYLARLAYIPYRDAFRMEMKQRREMFESDEYKESKEPEYVDTVSRFRLRSTSSAFTLQYSASTINLVDKWMESKIRDAIHNPVPRHEWGKQAPARDDFKWVLLEGLWVKNYDYDS
jgi:myosin heavy subunit